MNKEGEKMRRKTGREEGEIDVRRVKKIRDQNHQGGGEPHLD